MAEGEVENNPINRSRSGSLDPFVLVEELRMMASSKITICGSIE
jgi:hypothetical protein